jgi:CheY-like chemotaxis protein
MARPLALLLVNDEEDGLFLLDHAVKREFPSVETIACRSAAEALACLGRRAVDAVVTDNRMPAVTGVELVRLIRATNSRLPIIMLTGSDEKRNEALAAGVSAFICGGDWADIRRKIRGTIEAAATAATDITGEPAVRLRGQPHSGS